jgi:hypothetical protein
MVAEGQWHCTWVCPFYTPLCTVTFASCSEPDTNAVISALLSKRFSIFLFNIYLQVGILSFILGFSCFPAGKEQSKGICGRPVNGHGHMCNYGQSNLWYSYHDANLFMVYHFTYYGASSILFTKTHSSSEAWFSCMYIQSFLWKSKELFMACDFIRYGASYILFTKTQSSYETLFPAYVHSEFSLKEQSTFSWHVILIRSVPLR